MAKKSLGKTVLGWFVVDENAENDPQAQPDASADAAPDAGGTQSADDLIAKYAGGGGAPRKRKSTPPAAAAAAAAPTPLVQLKGDVPLASGGAVDFPAVFDAADISAEERERVEKAIALVQSLPKETPKEVKKQIVEASLKAFGIPIEQIIETGVQEIQALEAYIQHGEQGTQTVLAESTTKIAELTAEIETIKQQMAAKVEEQQALRKSCNDEKLRVQGAIEFFGEEAIARVVHESPKIAEPK